MPVQFQRNSCFNSQGYEKPSQSWSRRPSQCSTPRGSCTRHSSISSLHPDPPGIRWGSQIIVHAHVLFANGWGTHAIEDIGNLFLNHHSGLDPYLAHPGMQLSFLNSRFVVCSEGEGDWSCISQRQYQMFQGSSMDKSSASLVFPSLSVTRLNKFKIMRCLDAALALMGVGHASTFAR